jgi:hypothetical protein
MHGTENLKFTENLKDIVMSYSAVIEIYLKIV